MTDEPFLMVSLKGERAKKLAHALTNKSADKILAYLAEHEGATEKQIAQALKLPLSTVNYTMKVLLEARLVVADEYSYSPKGREVNHYKLARKYIVIAPDEEREGFLDRLKRYAPAAAIAVGVAGVAQAASMFWPSQQAGLSAESARVETALMADSAPRIAAEETTRAVSFAPADWLGPLLLGIFLAILAALLVDYIRKS